MPLVVRTKSRGMSSLRAWLMILVIHVLAANALAQDKTAVQVKTFDEKLKVFPNVEISINGGPFVAIGNRGVGFTDVSTHDLPPVSVTVKNDALEAASWNYSKGILEVVVRKKSYRLHTFRLQTTGGEILRNIEVSYFGKDTIKLLTNAQGSFEVPVPNDGRKPGISQFAINGYKLEKHTPSEREDILSVVAVRRGTTSKPVASKDASEYFQHFDLRNLDSIQSLTVFYAIFKNYQFSSLDKATRDRIDAKLYSLMGKMLDSVKVETNPFVTRISDSTFVSDDLRTLLHQAETEQKTLTELRAAFDSKIELINRKLEGGIGDLDPLVREQIWLDIARLEQILKENETRFYRNQSDYFSVLATMKEKFFDVTDLEEKLYVSEAQRIEERQKFKRNILTVILVTAVFALLSVLLIHISSKLRKKQGELVTANDQIRRMNDNLETLVYQRTALLEKAHKEMDIFLYKASHDLQGPICSIIGLCNIATHTIKGEGSELVQRTYNTAFAMDRMLKKLKLISEINRPREPSEVNLLDEFSMLQSSFSQFARDNNVRLTIDCNKAITFVAHRDLLHIALLNLVENALHFSALRRDTVPEVQLKGVSQTNSIQISIIDNGIGIPDDAREKVWDMFYVGNEHSVGNGLGLYIVRKCVQAMNGYISMESQENHFTRIVMVIPVMFENIQIPKEATPAVVS